MNRKLYALLALLMCMSTWAFSQNVVVVGDGDINAGDNVTWTADNIYHLDGFVFVEAGATLTIEAGTVIKGLETPSTNDNASALIIARDAQIFANGTESAPIIFTAEIDDTTDPADTEATDRGLWGGLIILGNGTLGARTAETRVEGIPEGEARALFGGTDDADNSGVLRYVSIRHGGAELSPGDEINGLTLGGVGSGTTIEHIEVIANSDDGIEFFGGAVNVKFATVSFSGDDSFDWDLGWQGKGQFWFALHGADNGDNGGELDGAQPDDNARFSSPTIYNATFIGAGCDGNAANSTAVLFRDGTGGIVQNSIFTDYNEGIEVEDLEEGLDSRQRYENGELVVGNSLWPNFCTDLLRGTSGRDTLWLLDSLLAAGNTLEDPMLRGVSRMGDGGLDPRPAFGGVAFDGAADLPEDDSFFQVANYKGAFGGTLWLRNWTALDEYGFLTDESNGCLEIVTITDGDLVGGETYNWSNDKCYLLDGFVFLEEGGVLNIQEGTTIFGKETPSTNDNASALIITRGAQIFANGTEDAPIVFTTEFDDITASDDLDFNDRGLWGGVIILGNGTLGARTSETRVEGIPEGEPRALFGGTDDSDNSGSMSFVSIRHGGAELAPGDEINGLTLGGVGNGTNLDHIEVIANQDDGIEFFGGAVDLKFATVAFAGDDSFDWDLGWQGKGQFWFALLDENDGDNGGELDGAQPDDNPRFSSPTIYNATFIGAGCEGNASNATAVLFRDGTGGIVQNSVFVDFNEGIEVEDLAEGLDSRQRLENGELVVGNSLWDGFCTGLIRGTGGTDTQWLLDSLVAAGNIVGDPQITSISRTNDNMLDPRPVFGGPGFGSGADLPDDEFFQVANYKGAFGNTLWLRNWTALDEFGFLAEDSGAAGCTDIVIVTDGDINAGETVNWTNDNCYVLDGFVFVEEGATLNIQAGTTIYGRETPSTNDNASALIIARGATINAEGTAEAPITFTSELALSTELSLTDRGLWGGLIILGNGNLGARTAETRVEGIPEGEPRALFGGTDDTDNSGVLTYVSIRHGGAELAPGDEINGLTLGGVGSGTTLQHIEVLANQDDGIEFFGGAVDLKYAAVGFCGDDSFDWDLGWRGKGQFWLALLDEANGDNGGELDGAQPDDNERYSDPTIFNATFIGAGCDGEAANSTALLFRDGTAGEVRNSILTGFEEGIEVEDLAEGLDSRQRMEDGELKIANNIWFGFCSGDEVSADGLIRPTSGGEDETAEFLVLHLVAHNNAVADPGLTISRTADGTFNPLPGIAADATRSLLNSPYPDGDDFFTPVCFQGAFGEDKVWIQGWTAMAQLGLLDASLTFGNYDPSTDGCFVTSTEQLEVESAGYVLRQNTPNPFYGATQIGFTTPKATNVTISVYDLNGKQVARIVDNARFGAGEHTVEFNAENLARGMYYYNLTTQEVSLTKEFVIMN